MTFVRPSNSRNQVRKAGECLVSPSASPEELEAATAVMTNWRSAHGYPLNTFQATLRNKLREIDKVAIVGQRLKRAPSIIAKLTRYRTMKLSQMQDIAGLRAIVSTMPKLRRVHLNYRNSNFSHELVKTDNYVSAPKADGYRSIHLIYRYDNILAPEYEGLFVELQLRTQLQHAWATAVETVDAFFDQSIKAGRPAQEWARFFKLASAAFANLEQSAGLAEFEGISPRKLHSQLVETEKALKVLLRLRAFRVATHHVASTGRHTAGYHLVVLNTEARRVNVTSFLKTEHEKANAAYAEAEKRATENTALDPVLVTGGSMETLRKSFPNYFLDTDIFVRRMYRVLSDGLG